MGIRKRDVMAFRACSIVGFRLHRHMKPGCLAYLYTRDGTWLAALPNGITGPDANHDESVLRSRLADAPEIASLHSRRYTYGLPLEIWIALFIVLVPMTILAVLATRWLIRRKMRVRSTGPWP